jgi:hypothetical protein
MVMPLTSIVERNELEAVVEEMRDVIKQVFGILLDARQGFHHLTATMERVQASLVGTVHGATIQTLDESQYSYSDGPPQHHPDDPGAPLLHNTTQGELKLRNRRGGQNDVFFGNMCLVAIFTYWEDHYRAQIAKALGREKNDLKAPVFGDIRLIRNSIIHHREIALADIERCEVLRWFSKGEGIAISTDQFRQLASEVNKFLDKMIADARAAA